MMDSIVSSTTKEDSPAPVAPRILNFRRTRCASCSENGLSTTSIPSESRDPPESFATRRTRTESTSGKTAQDILGGKVKYFCRSRGFGFLTPDKPVEGYKEFFMHISDIEGEYVPRKNDQVKFRLCPIPPRFERFQAVQVRIINFTPEVHHKWDVPETPEEFKEEEEEVIAAQQHYDT